MNEMIGVKTYATDGEMGTVHDVYFDDLSWRIRYMVIDTGNWLPGRRVLVSPELVGEPDWDDHRLPVSLTKDQVEGSPSIDTDKPVSRQQELELAAHFGYAAYFAPAPGPEIQGMPLWAAARADDRKEPASSQEGDPNLRSVREVIGYHIHASDGEIGHVEDFVAQTDGWAIRYMIVDTRNWLPGRKVLVSPLWTDRIVWGKQEVHVDLTRNVIETAPEFAPSGTINRDDEAKLFDHYKRPVYWR
jgi:uncharacterized protein YrrD